MDILTAVNDATSRLSAPDTLTDISTAAGTGEAAALALVHLGERDNAPAYLTAADAFAELRDELDHLGLDRPARPAESIAWDAEGTDAVRLEFAVAELAARVANTLAELSTRLQSPDIILAVGRAAAAAAEASVAMTRESGDAGHIR